MAMAAAAAAAAEAQDATHLKSLVCSLLLYIYYFILGPLNILKQRWQLQQQQQRFKTWQGREIGWG